MAHRDELSDYVKPKVYRFDEHRPVCKLCGKTVAQPSRLPDGRTRGNCPEHGRVNTKWVPR